MTELWIIIDENGIKQDFAKPMTKLEAQSVLRGTKLIYASEKYYIQKIEVKE